MINSFFLIVFLSLTLLAISFVEQVLVASGGVSISDRLQNHFLKLKLDDKVAHLIIAGLVILFFAFGVCADIGLKFEPEWVLLIVSLFGGGAVYIVLKDRAMRGFIKDNKYLVGWGSALVALLVNNVARAVTDGEIADAVSFEAGNFPVAQGFVSIVVTLFVWVLALSLIAIIAYVLAAVVLLIGKNMDGMGSSARFCGPGLKKHRKKQAALKTIRLAAIMLGSIVYGYIAPEAIERMSSAPWFGRLINSLIVFSSYHLKPDICGLSNMGEGVWVAQIRYKWASVAIPDKDDGYVFVIKNCPVRVN
ncbi:hypothetical protein [Pseudomonas alcaligenes]|uniref:hypothetical protein n=1 Tax=Aquipseudomonas alcaligenes TaxID=43263 RepID=UPI00358F14DF